MLEQYLHGARCTWLWAGELHTKLGTCRGDFLKVLLLHAPAACGLGSLVLNLTHAEKIAYPTHRTLKPPPFCATNGSEQMSLGRWVGKKPPGTAGEAVRWLVLHPWWQKEMSWDEVKDVAGTEGLQELLPLLGSGLSLMAGAAELSQLCSDLSFLSCCCR